MAEESTSGDVLSELDDRPPTAFHWKLTVLSTLGGFLFGYDTSDIGAALNFVPYHLPGFWQGYLVAGLDRGRGGGVHEREAEGARDSKRKVPSKVTLAH
jgi:SP family arabinose:H+ symporter-like MFS transporter